ncbi:HSF-type DNA-binding-domain-containing protein [Roridomyces roridus]|uniref:HSF-type DNA-binding-domain-containing protein n=1 Tax=Roridomyces roridus TaxID=1738132 RepID=A0AAD7FJH0_9AGAR|nr:HSF-type DNA-binding-domain-containing protein [Roridomyces roridus]
MSDHSTTEFVKKLYTMLEDSSIADVICWAPQGDRFVIKNPTEFTASVSPRIFKHSNFSSFVRQLNKYAFHKVRDADEDPLSTEQTWIFQHPDFRMGRRDLLEHIKRQVPQKPSADAEAPWNHTISDFQTIQIESLQSRLSSLDSAHQNTMSSLRTLERNQEALTLQNAEFQRSLAQQNGLLRALVQLLWRERLGSSADELNPDAALNFPEMPDMALPTWGADDLQRVVDVPTQLITPETSPKIAEPTLFPPSTSSPAARPSPNSRSHGRPPLPHWIIPPHILLVDDDAVTRKLSSKFLRVLGCTADVAEDGVSAVDKLHHDKYDLVLMDIFMPQLDGVSATSVIRTFDPETPIISMTGSSRPTEIMTYYCSGMNDILPKPFTKKGLSEVLEKHLGHLALNLLSSTTTPASPEVGNTGFEVESSWQSKLSAMTSPVVPSVEEKMLCAPVESASAVDDTLLGAAGEDCSFELFSDLLREGVHPSKRPLEDGCELEERQVKRARIDNDSDWESAV